MSLFTIILSVGLFVAYMTILPPYLIGTDKLLNSGTIDSEGNQSIDSGRRYQQLLGGSVFDSNKIHNNKEDGIILNKNISNSTISNNIFYNNEDQVQI